MNISELSKHMWANVDKVVRHLLPEGKLESGEWTCGSVSGDKGKSLKVNVAGKNVWQDFATGDSGDLIDLWMLNKSCDINTAITEAKAFFGIKDEPGVFTQRKKKYSMPTKRKVRAKGSLHVEYLKSRGLSEETIKKYKVCDGVAWDRESNKEIPAVTFPYIWNGEAKFIKYIGIDRPNGKKVIDAEKDCEPCLFGWQAMQKSQRMLLLTEGEIDCMSFYELGFGNALSVPFGGGKGGKHQWIDSEYHNLDRFEEIFICMDNDEAGNSAAKDIATRLGIERCRIIELPYKDVNECLIKGVDTDKMLEIIAGAKFLDPDELAPASQFLQDTIAAFYNKDEGLFKSRWLALNNDFSFRESELTIVNGVNGHGKSQVVGQMMLDAMSNGVRCCVASMELKPDILLKRLTRQALCMKIPPHIEIEAAFNFYDENLWLFSLTGTAKADRLLEIFSYANKRYGIKLFVIDSLMKCGIAEDDYNGQKEFIDKVSDFKNDHNAHVILVTHSKKAESEEKPTGKMDVKGTGSITDLADNLFIIWRNKIREQALQAMSNGRQIEEKEQKFASLPGALLILDKQRNGEGWLGKIGLYFDEISNQYKEEENISPWNYIYGQPQQLVEHETRERCTVY